jgi:hypothetical protein
MPELPRAPCCSGRGRRGLVSTALVGATQEAPRGGESQYVLLPALLVTLAATALVSISEEK